MRPSGIIPFGKFAPDQGKTSGQSPVMKGVLPKAGRYAPWPDLQQVRAGSMLNDACLGGRSFYDSNGVPVAFLGDAGRRRSGHGQSGLYPTYVRRKKRERSHI